MIVKTEIDLIQNYLSDASNYKSKSCDGLFIPENYDELVTLIKISNEKKTPVTISGAGTGLVGGRVPKDGIIVSMEKFNEILDLNLENKTVKVQSFVTLNELQNYLDEFGLFYPPDPTEKNCSIGGTIATNASGARTLKYGPTRRWVNALKILLPDGEVLDLKRGQWKANGYIISFETGNGNKYNFKLPEFSMPQVKNAAGYYILPDMDLIDLFIGSEGTLGIILEAELRLLEKPLELISMVIFFDNFNDVYKFVSIARKEEKEEAFKKIKPRALEFFDDKSLKFLSEKFPMVSNKKFAVWYEQEIYKEEKEEILEQLSELILKSNGNLDDIWFAFNEKEINNIKEFRHSISVLVNEYISRNNLKKVGTDIAVPAEYFREFYRYCCEQCKKYSIEYVGYGHIGNNHLHFNMLPSDEEQNELAIRLYKDFCIKAVEMKGTISAEHGIGKLKAQYFELMYPYEVLKSMFEIKRVFDPNLILNRGNIFSEKFYS